MFRVITVLVFCMSLAPVAALAQVAMPRGTAADAPAVSDCGGTTAANPGSTTAAGSVTEGRWATGCTITFRRALPNGHCTVTSPSGGTVTAYTDPVAAELVVRNTRDTQNTIAWTCS